MKTSQKGIDLIKRLESFRSKPYYCAAGVLTIGYGHTRTVFKNLVVTEKQAEELLISDLQIFEKQLNYLYLNLNQNQYDAIISFIFNLGIGNFRKSTLLKKIKLNPDDLTIAGEFVKWIKAGGKRLRGLLLRRIAESELYFTK